MKFFNLKNTRYLVVLMPVFLVVAVSAIKIQQYLQQETPSTVTQTIQYTALGTNDFQRPDRAGIRPFHLPAPVRQIVTAKSSSPVKKKILKAKPVTAKVKRKTAQKKKRVEKQILNQPQHLHYIQPISLAENTKPSEQWRAKFSVAKVEAKKDSKPSWSHYLANFKTSEGFTLSKKLELLARNEEAIERRRAISLQEQMAQYPKQEPRLAATNNAPEKVIPAPAKPRVGLAKAVEASTATQMPPDQANLQKMFDEYSLDKLRDPDKVSVKQPPEDKITTTAQIASEDPPRLARVEQMEPSEYSASEYSDLVGVSQNMTSEQVDSQRPSGLHVLDQVSGRVSKTIAREMRRQGAPLVAPPRQKNTHPFPINWNPNAQNSAPVTLAQAGAQQAKCIPGMVGGNCSKNLRAPLNFAAPANRNAGKAKGRRGIVRIETYEYDLTKGEAQKLYGYKFRPFYNPHQSEVPDDQGVLTIERTTNSHSAIIGGGLHSHGTVPVNLDLVLENASSEQIPVIEVPLLETRSFRKFLESKNINSAGGHLLIKVSDSAMEFDIDKDPVDKIFLNEKMQEVKGSEPWSYVLFVGIEEGNLLLKYRVDRQFYTSKVIHIVDGEIYFEPGEMLENSIDTFEIVESDILAKKPRPLSIPSGEVLLFSNDSPSRSRGLHRHEFTNLMLPLGTRQYIELKHIDGSIFVGKWDHDTVEVPSRDFIAILLEQFEIPNFSQYCMVQFNLPSKHKLVEMTLTGQTGTDYLDRDVYYLETDGTFNDEPTVRAKKFFVVGKREGVFNLELEYASGVKDYLRSYCAKDTYIVEQV